MEKVLEAQSSYSSADEQKFVNCTLSGPVEVSVKAGRIVRIVPLNYGQDDTPDLLEGGCLP